MMKKIFTLIICLAITGGMFAQEKGFSWGVKAGLNLSDFIGKDTKDTKMKANLNAGIFTEFRCSDKFSVGPELVYSAQGTSLGKIDGETLRIKAEYINLPIMAKYYVANKFSINLGPQLGYAISMKGKAGSEKEKFDKDTYNKFDFSIGVGGTYNFGKFFADARYNFGLTKVIKDSKTKNSVIQIGVGYRF